MKSRGSANVDAVRAVYDKDAQNYDDTRMKSGFLRDLDQAERIVIRENLPQLGLILEVGAGTGRLTGELLNISNHLVAIDYSPEMLRILQQKYADEGKLEAFVWDAYELARLPGYGSFDGVVSMRMLPHIEDMLTILKLFQGAVRPGGWVVTDFWNRQSFRYWKKRGAHVYNHYVSYDEAQALLKSADLDIVTMEGAGLKPFWLGKSRFKKYAYSLIAFCQRPK